MLHKIVHKNTYQAISKISAFVFFETFNRCPFLQTHCINTSRDRRNIHKYAYKNTDQALSKNSVFLFLEILYPSHLFVSSIRFNA